MVKIRNISTRLEGLPERLLFLIGLSLNFLAGFIDYTTGTYVGTEIVYLLPIFFVSWFSGRKAGILMSVISAVTLAMADVSAARRHDVVWIWNPAAHLAMFAIFAYLLSGIKRALHKISEGKNLLASILESAGEGIYGIDRNGDHTMVNPAAVRMLGHEVSELIGRHSHPIWHHTRADGTPYPQEQCRIYATLRDGAVKHITDEVFWRKDGTPFPVDYTVAPIWDKGRITGAVIVFRDITERRQAEEALRQSEQRFSAFMLHLPAAAWIKDLQGRYVYANAEAVRIFSMPLNALLGKTDFEVFAPETARQFVENDHKMLTDGGSIQTVEVLRQSDGIEHHSIVSKFAVPGLNGKPARIAGVAFDITELKRAEEDLMKAMADLARSNKDLEQFAYAISHDLKAPLRSMSSFAQLLFENYRGRFDDEADKYIDFIVRGAERMQRMIDDILAYSRVGTHGLEFSTVDFEAVLSQAVENLRSSVEESGAVVTHDALPMAKADQAQMIILLQNLLSNAIKFSIDKPRIHVTAARKGGEWVFSVKDNGIGIAPEHADRIFIIFQRLHTENEFPGTGIGLAVCKKIVDRHGGWIWVESVPGKGSTFFFSLPAGEP